MTLLDSIDEATARSLLSGSTSDRSSFGEEAFRRMLVIERKRTERSGKPFLLMLVGVGNLQCSEKNGKRWIVCCQDCFHLLERPT